MTRNKLKKLIREVITETAEMYSRILPPNSPSTPFTAGTETLSISNFTRQQLKVTTKNVSGVVFVDIRDG